MILPILIALCVFVVVSHDHFLYHSPVGKITAVKTLSSHEVSDDFQNKDRQIVQELQVKILNDNKKTLTLQNTTTSSQTTDQLFRVGQQVILQKIAGQVQIVSLKRDALISALLVYSSVFNQFPTFARFPIFVGLFGAKPHLFCECDRV